MINLMIIVVFAILEEKNSGSGGPPQTRWVSIPTV